MNKPMRKIHPLIKMANNMMIDLPCPSSISLWWNLGSLLGMCLIMQLITGIFLAMHYTANINMAFESMIHIIRNVNNGWLIRSMHANGASLFFMCMYMHIGRSMYYGSFKLKETWMVGVLLLVLTMATAFLGYVLPWGQMSLWGATVITNLMSVIPYLGKSIVMWLWGGFAIENATLTRFFTLHFMTPFIMLMMVMIHLLFLHLTGSNNPMGVNSNIDKIPFHPYFSSKDMLGMIMIFFIFMMINLMEPRMLGDPENFMPANPMITPIHIQPEWYFLFAYAILRSIPNKMGGVIAMLMAIMILMTMPNTFKPKLTNCKFYPLNKILFWFMVFDWMMLTWIGSRPAEEPFIMTGQIMSTAYFMYFILSPMMFKFWDKITK